MTNEARIWQKGKGMVKTGEYEDGIWQKYCKDEHFSLVNSLKGV